MTSATKSLLAKAIAWIRRHKIILGAIVTVGGALVTGLVDVGRAWYQLVYLPAALPASVIVTHELEPVGEAPDEGPLRGAHAYRVHVEVENPGSRRVALVWGQYVVTTTEVQRRDGTESVADDYRLCGDLTSSEAFGTRSTTRAVATGRFFTQSWIDPGQTASDDRIVFIDPAGVDGLALTVTLAVAKGDVLVPTDYVAPDWVGSPPDTGTVPYCSWAYEGDFASSVLTGFAWRAVSTVPIVGRLFPPDRRVVVEWRSMRVVGASVDGSGECDPYAESATCAGSFEVGATDDDSFVSPMIAICDHRDCRLYDYLSNDERIRLVDELGLAFYSSRSERSLWE